MSLLGWMASIGVVLLFMALASAQVKRLPVSTSLVYLIVGIVVGPLGFGLLALDMPSQREWLETLCEMTVIVSLFVGGLRLRLPLRHPSWRTALMLAGPIMVVCILATGAATHLILGLPVFVSLLLGAILAPTDPVLASAVAVEDAEDHDRVRFALSGEAGLNDGAALPFVIFALEALHTGGLGTWTLMWAAHELVWAVAVGLGIGYGLGVVVGKFAIDLRSRQRDTSAPSDFLALALIALAFVGAEWLSANGFLAVFAAGVGLRHAEWRVAAQSPSPDSWKRMRSWIRQGRARRRHTEHPPAESLVSPNLSEDEIEEPVVAAGVLIAEALSFGDTVERLLEMMLVVLVGVAVSSVWNPQAAILAGLLFLVIRPAASLVLLRWTRTARLQRWLLGWFGIKGIGSLYYLTYALGHGVPDALQDTVTGVVITVVACSVAAHGISMTPVLSRYERAIGRERSGHARRPSQAVENI